MYISTAFVCFVKTKDPSADRSFVFVWLVRDSNPRRLSRLIYSQIPLAAWVTSQCSRPPVISRTGACKEYPINLFEFSGLIQSQSWVELVSLRCSNQEANCSKQWDPGN